jgi:phosphomannomutase
MIGEIFKAYDVRAVYPGQFNEDAAWKVGFAAGVVLRRQVSAAEVAPALPRTVVVSRDMRPSSPALAAALIDGLRSAEMNVIDVGMCDTPLAYFAVNELGTAGGIQVTASHNPIEYNGLKFSGYQARPIGAATGLKDIQAEAEALGAVRHRPPQGTLEERDLWDGYRAHVLANLPPLKRKVKVVIDASNGMAGKMIPAVFDGVANLEIIPLNFQITGSFVHPPDPLVAANMLPTQQAVAEHKADLGVCFDGDADRCIITDEAGRIIGCDHLTALLAGRFLEQSPGATVVYDLRSSKVLEETIRGCGGIPERCRVGHVFMKAALRKSDGVFGGELSGHFYFRSNFFTDSGAICFAALLGVAGQGSDSIGTLIEPFRRYPQSGEMNFKIEDKLGAMQALKDKYPDAAVDELDGVTIDAFGDAGWWFNVRASNTEPLLRLNAEARDQSTLDTLLAQITPMLGERDAGH